VSRRGQLVLAAAGVVAVALVPVALAYLQLGYGAGVGADAGVDRGFDNAERLLARGVHDAAVAAGTTPWSDRATAVDETRRELRPWLDRLRTARLDRGVSYRVAYNRTAAREFADRNCPGGRGRSFGPCRASEGVVVQERAGETHVLAVAVDLTVTGPDGTTRATTVVRAVGGPVA
jgi:hypothetical protein